ncbi:MAG: dolichyl-phosphate beta-glucosyltransferase [Chloroflexota bacterium]
MAAPFLSVIIPAYNEERRLPDTLDQLDAFLGRQAYASQVLVVENGSQDRTLEIARQYAARLPYLQAIHLEGRGKGLAVRHGMLAAGGAYRFMCDADLSMPVEQIARFLPPAIDPAVDIAIGSREAYGARRFDEPAYRHIGGRLVNWMIRLLVLPGLQDTQCGFKCLTAAAAEQIFRHMTLDGWAFDVEMLFIARRLGLQVRELPIPWYYQAESKVNAGPDTLRMLGDLLRIRRNALMGMYPLSQ